MPIVFNQKQHDKLAQKLVKTSLKNIQRLLVSVGKPFYILLLLLFVLLTIIFAALNHFTKRLSTISIHLLPKTLHSTSELFISTHKNLAKTLKTLLTKIQKLTLKIKKSKIAKKKYYKIYLPKSKLYLLKLPFPKITIRKIPFSKIFTQKFFWIITSCFLMFTVLIIVLLKIVLYDLPSPEQLVNRKVQVSTKIYDRNGILLYNIYKDQNRTPVPLEKIPLRVRLATLAIEDAEFYKHPGFSIRGIIRATIKNFREGELTGGSTITQQLVKNTLLSPEKTLTRKLREIILAVQVELKFSKDEILEMYLNEVSYGGTAYGIQEAARVYFGKDVEKLSLSEAALLAGLPKSPTQYSPFGVNPDLALARQKEVLNLMRINGYITENQQKEAEEEKITFAENKIDIKAPHFVMHVRQILEEKYGKEVVETGGLEVITTLDYQVQKLAEKVVAKEVESLSKLNVGNGAALVINPKTGDILAMAGSRNYFDTEHDGNVNVTLRQRQPGSSIKVVNYAYALQNGLTPATILNDSPVVFNVEGQKPYKPKNYDGDFRGYLTLRDAFAQSRNIPAVKVLASYGVEKMIEQGRKMGITTWTNPKNYGLSLTLGGGEVRLIDLARVYATVANYGKRPPINPLIKVTNFKGKILEENGCTPAKKKSKFNIAENITKDAVAAEASQKDVCKFEQAIDDRIAFMLIDILKDNRARTPAFGSNSLLNIPGHPEVAVKTGTSNDLRDNLAIGFNSDYLVAVWVGNNDNSPMGRIASGITGATPIFNKIMSALLANKENRQWPVPEGLIKVRVCKYTGTLPCQGCPAYFEWFLQENAPTKSCNPEVIKQILDKRKEGKLLDEAASVEN